MGIGLKRYVEEIVGSAGKMAWKEEETTKHPSETKEGLSGQARKSTKKRRREEDCPRITRMKRIRRGRGDFVVFWGLGSILPGANLILLLNWNLKALEYPWETRSHDCFDAHLLCLLFP